MQAQLYDDFDPGTDDAWQRPDLMAQRLSVTVRTVRSMVSRGELERLEAGGRVYVRRPPGGASEGERIREDGSTGSGWKEADNEGADPHLPALVERLQTTLIEVTREHAATVAELHSQVRAEAAEASRIRVEAAESRLLAEVATRDAEQAAAHLEVTRAELATERQLRRAAELYAITPWWRRRQRAELRAELVAVAGLLP